MKGNFRDKMANMMSGRYGVDELGRVIIFVGFVCAVVSLFTGGLLLTVITAALLVWYYVRVFSRNHTARIRENQKYLQLTEPLRRKFDQWKRDRKTRKTHHIYTCPACKQRIRIPKGKGNIMITCPKCKYEFNKKS